MLAMPKAARRVFRSSTLDPLAKPKAASLQGPTCWISAEPAGGSKMSRQSGISKERLSGERLIETFATNSSVPHDEPPPPASMPRPGWGLKINGWNGWMDRRVAGERPGKRRAGSLAVLASRPASSETASGARPGAARCGMRSAETINTAFLRISQKIWRERGQSRVSGASRCLDAALGVSANLQTTSKFQEARRLVENVLVLVDMHSLETRPGLCSAGG